MLLSIKKFVSANKVATSYLVIGFFMLTSIFFLIVKNRYVSEQREKVLLLNTMRLQTLSLQYSFDVVSPEFIPKVRITTALDSISDGFESFTDGEINYLKTLSPDDLSENEEVIIYANKLLEQLNRHSNDVVFKQIVQDSIKRFYEFKKVFDSETETFKQLPIERRIYQKYFSGGVKNKIETASVLIVKLSKQLDYLYNYYYHELYYQIQVFEWITIGVAIFLFATLIGSYAILNNVYFAPLDNLTSHASKLIAGKYFVFNEYLSFEFKLIGRAINVLINEINSVIGIVKGLNVKDIESQQVKYKEFLSQDKPLSNAFKTMYSNLGSLARVEAERNWSVEGHAKFGALLNKSADDYSTTLDIVMAELVKYVGGLQGAVFTVQDGEGNSELSLSSLYAYDRKKYLSKKVLLGEGLVGQVWQEKKPMIIEDLPEDHTLIKSGLGEKRPKSLVIFPIIENEVFHGVLEIAGFEKFEGYKVDFISSICDAIASSMTTVSINNRTKKLLNESRELTQKMKRQEEDRRSHLKEMKAAQEEIEKREIIKENEIKALKQQVRINEDEFRRKEKGMASKLGDLEKELTNSLHDNATIRDLNDKIFDLEKQKEKEILDLQETIKIKDMRIDKLRKKIQKLNE